MNLECAREEEEGWKTRFALKLDCRDCGAVFVALLALCGFFDSENDR